MESHRFVSVREDSFAVADPAAARVVMGTSAPIREVERALGWLAAAEVNLLLQGEAGTGKRVLAEAIHRQSPRGAGPFYAVSLTSRSESQLASELFAVGGENELLGDVHGATLYLEDVASLPVRLQRRVLRALRADPGRRNVRIIASTVTELEEAVRLGRFLPELYAHLGLIRLTIPPLRERREDIIALTEYFVRRFCERTGSTVRVARSALAELTGYAWPGNARELQQTLEAALALTRTGELTAERIRTVLGRRPRRHVAPDVFPLRELERDYIATVLSRCHWNQSLAARRLGIGRNTLMRKIKSFKLEKSEAA